MATLNLRLVTPTEEIISGAIDWIHLPGEDGEMEIYPLHEPLITQIVAGELFYRKDGKLTFLAVGEGFAEITGDSVSLLTDSAIDDARLDQAEIEAAIQRAQDALRAHTLVGEEVEATQVALARSTAQLNFKRRRRGTV